MKTILALGSAALFLSAAIQTHADIIVGPITNPNNGHDYYLLTPNTWKLSEDEAEALGGTLAIIRNDSEQNWVYSVFSGLANHNGLWIGLHRTQMGGPFVWVTGAPTNNSYCDWANGEPNNSGGVEDCVHMRDAGTWNDLSGDNMLNGVVEVSQEKTLSENEKILIGTWYEGGRIDRICYFTGTANLLFAIGNYGQSSRIIYSPGNHLFAPNWHARGEIKQDDILWSDGTWWSRKPSNYPTGETFGRRQMPLN
jgi:hypothetical protein